MQLEGITYDFCRVKTKEALEVRKIVMKGLSSVMRQAKENGQDVSTMSEADFDLGEMTELLAEIEPYALKYVRILNADGKTWTENPSVDVLETFFTNEHYAMAISQEFLKRIQGFLASLPSSQNTMAKK